MSGNSFYASELKRETLGISYPTFSNYKVPFRSIKANMGHSEYGHPIPTNVGFEQKIFTSIRDAFFKKVSWDYTPNISPSVDDEVYRFYMAILAYYESSNPVIKPGELFSLILKGAEGITWLKKVRTYAMIHSLDCIPLEANEEDEYYIQEAKRFHLVDLGDFFNVRYWLFWDQPDDEAWKELFTPLEYDKASLKKFEETCYQVIPELVLDVVEEEEILLEATSSSSLSLGRNEPNKPNWFNKQRNNYFSNKPLHGKISYVQKCPGDTRSPLTLSVPHSNSVKLIEKQIAKIAAECPYSCYVKDNDEYFKRYDDFAKRNQYFLCRDIKKDGLTKNRELVKAVLRVIKAKYPHLPCCKYFDIFSDFTVEINGKIYNPPRGVGLGMTSAITTIIQAVCLRMSLDELYSEYTIGSVEGLFYHDDAAFGSDSEDTILTFESIDFNTCTKLGLVVNKRKSFAGRNFVLCEHYSDPIFDKKESYQRMSLKQLHASENITHAKFQWLSVYRYVDPEYWEFYIKELTNHFGYEFYEQETGGPALLGGWIPYSYQKVDVSLYMLDRLPYKTEQAASLCGLEPVKHYPGKRRFGKTKYRSPVEQLYPHITNFGESQVFLTNLTLDQVSGQMTRLDKIGLTSWYWRYQREARLSKYKRILADPNWIDCRDWIKMLRDLHPTSDILPYKWLLTYEPVEKYPEISSLFRPANPRMSYLKALNPTALSDKIVPWPELPDQPTSSTLSLTSFERTKVKFESHFFDRWTADLREMEIAKPTLRAINSKEWFSPMSVVSFILAMEHEEKVPVFCERTNKPVIPDELFYKVNDPNHEKLFPYLVGRLGFERTKAIDLTYFERELDLFLTKQRAKKLKEIKRLVEEQALPEGSIYTGEDEKSEDFSLRSSFEWTEKSLNDWDFFTWQTSKRNYLNWRNHFFARIDEKVVSLQVLESGFLQGDLDLEIDRTKFALTDPVEQHLYIESGGKLDDQFVPILNRNALSDSNESEKDIFKNSASGSEGSECGLFAGF